MNAKKRVANYGIGYAIFYGIVIGGMDELGDWKSRILILVLVLLLLIVLFDTPFFFKSLAVWFSDLEAESPARFKMVVWSLWGIHFLVSFSLPFLIVWERKAVFLQWEKNIVFFVILTVVQNFVVLSLELVNFYRTQRENALH